MLTLSFLLSTALNFYVLLLLLRVWLQAASVDFYDPFSQLVVRITQPLVKLLRRLIAPFYKLDTAALLLAFLLLTIRTPLLVFIQTHTVLYHKNFLLTGLLALLKTSGKLLFWVLLMRVLLNWTSKGRHPIDAVLYQLTEPLLKPIRCRLPAVTGLDFSVMVVMLLLIALDYLGVDLFGSLWSKL